MQLAFAAFQAAIAAQQDLNAEADADYDRGIVEIALFGVELVSEPAQISHGIGLRLLARDGGKPRQHFRFLAWLEHIGFWCKR